MLFKANGVEWVKGTGRSRTRTRSHVEGGEDVTFKTRDRRDRRVPAAPADRGHRLAALRRLDRALLAQTEVPQRLVILGGGIIGCEFASIFAASAPR